MEDLQHQQMGYDRAATMFAPDGRILQVEYAEKTIRLGSASVGVVCKEGVVIISDRGYKDKLVMEESANKINEIDDHIIAVWAGVSSDARVLIEKARLLAQQHRVTYDSPSGTEAIVQEIADIKQQFTQYGGSRPFGVSMIFAGMEDENSVLYTTYVTGNYLRYKANAIGENDDKIKTQLREKYRSDMTIKETIKLILGIFKNIQGDDYNVDRFDAGILQKKGNLLKLSGKEIEKY
jgi:proteasome alpha subunit